MVVRMITMMTGLRIECVLAMLNAVKPPTFSTAARQAKVTRLNMIDNTKLNVCSYFVRGKKHTYIHTYISS